MRLLKVVFYVPGYKGEVLVEVGRNAVTLFGILERDTKVEIYYVYDLTILQQMNPEQYGWGDLPKWRRRKEEGEDID